VNVHSVSPSGLHTAAEARTEEDYLREVAPGIVYVQDSTLGYRTEEDTLIEVAPSALQTATGGMATVGGAAGPNHTIPPPGPIIGHWPQCTPFVGLHHP
jgi:hypothetical protein